MTNFISKRYVPYQHMYLRKEIWLIERKQLIKKLADAIVEKS